VAGGPPPAGPAATPAVAWDWSAAALGAACALPAAAVAALDDPARGAALAVGVLPALIVGLPPTRRGRLVLPAVGALIGLPILLGTVLAGLPVLAVLTILVLGPASAWLAARRRIGMLVMTLALPMVGVGLSYDDTGKGAGIAALILAGSAWACLVSMLWPERPRPAQARPAAAPPTIGYGVRLGLAGATAAAIGFLAGLEHVGWATAAALLVMRPVADMQRLRSVGRVAAVALGALLAIGLVRLDPATGWFGLAAIVALATAAATHGSRWYVTPAFTTFLVFLLLLYATPDDATSRFDERLLETVLGVGLAYVFGLAIPAAVGRARARRTK